MEISVADLRKAIADLDGRDTVNIEIEQSGSVIGHAESISAYTHADGSVTLTVEF